MSIAILDYRLPQYSFYPFNAFIHQPFDFRGCKSDPDHFPSCPCISMVLCVYAYRNCLQNARFSLLYAVDAKYRFDITFPNSFRNIERPKHYRHKDFIYSLFYFLVVMVGRGGGGGYSPSRLFQSFWAESIVAAKTGDPQNKPPGHPQAELGLSNMWELGLSNMWPELCLNPHRWDDERYRVLKVISGLNHSGAGAAEFCFIYIITCAGRLSFI